jgi:hypothetical protein
MRRDSVVIKTSPPPLRPTRKPVLQAHGTTRRSAPVQSCESSQQSQSLRLLRVVKIVEH